MTAFRNMWKRLAGELEKNALMESAERVEERARPEVIPAARTRLRYDCGRDFMPMFLRPPNQVSLTLMPDSWSGAVV